MQQVSAQSFRDRVLGGTLSKQASPGGGSVNGEDAGSLSGAERFLRSNRKGKSFVGTTPETTGFVGAAQAEGASGPAINNINANRAQLSPTLLNPPRPPARKTGIYEPRLTPAFRVPNTGSVVSSESLSKLIEQVDSEERFSEARVVLTDRTAVLTGRVSDPRDRELLEDLLKLEPGVEIVQNELVVEQRPAPPGSP